MATDWSETLRKEEVKEFSFFPQAYTPFDESRFVLPDIDLEYDGGDNDSSDQDSQTPNWVKNLSFTVGGVTIGAAAVYGLFAATPPSPAPVCATPIVQTAPSTPATHANTHPSTTSSTPRGSAGTSSPASAPASSAAATSSAPSSTTGAL